MDKDERIKQLESEVAFLAEDRRVLCKQLDDKGLTDEECSRLYRIMPSLFTQTMKRKCDKYGSCIEPIMISHPDDPEEVWVSKHRNGTISFIVTKKDTGMVLSGGRS